ncbi:O-antigen ligase family protein [Aestuariivirga sp.]|uniref:O-antigen ligase family protein n=1 Tax=Aestuariivirga sp. TaxID=2650926 RepID=UPI0039E5A8FD
MTADAFTPTHRPVTLLGISMEHVRAFAVWIMMASSFFVVIEPAPCDLLFIIALVLYAATGLSFPVLVAPLFFFLLIYNMGGFISFLEVSNEGKAGMFVITSTYMAVSGVFFACFVAEDPLRRMKIFTNGYVVGAVIASIIGLMGYFNFHGWAATMSPLQRVQGTFKDPNVISTYLIFPGLLLVQSFMLGGQRFALIRAAALLVIMAALFLAFSRGAWISFTASTLLMIVFTFSLTPSAPLRSRIIFLSVLGAGIVALLLVALLSIESVRSLFLDRLTLEKKYDAGEHGRFGIQANSIQYLLVSPQGFGPTLFRKIFGQDPHNVFLNAFASYGWLGGITYLMMTTTTIAIGFRTMLIRTPWQHYSIVVFFPLLTTILQGVQIDTDHWRHFYWLMGLQWGLFAASSAYAIRMRRQKTMATV